MVSVPTGRRSDDGAMTMVSVETVVGTTVLRGAGDMTVSRLVSVCDDVCNGFACTGPAAMCDDGNTCTAGRRDVA